MNLTENIKLALRAIRANLLRTVLTLLIIAFGIMALVGILTATEGIKVKMMSSFSEMGANTLTIKNEGKVKAHGHGRRERMSPITIQQATEFAERFRYPATVSISYVPDWNAIIKNETKKTNPNVRVSGGDEHFLKVSGQNIAQGRNFSKQEVQNGSDVMLIGTDVVKKIFNPYDTVVGSMVNVGDRKYRIVGLLAAKGASNVSTDNQVIVPLQNARRTFPSDAETSFTISVMLTDAKDIELGVEEATGVLRSIRKLRLDEENDFDIAKSERLAEQVLDQLSYVRIATIVIGILTLIGAGIGLMNIMLVSVNERTREIGISKALGATRRAIRIQFLTEAITICQIGGAFGIILGVLMGNLVGLFLKTGFVFPWLWVIGGFVFTFIIGLAAGLYPAFKAADLDPVEALRYE